MGYYIFSYCVSFETIEKAIGSSNNVLFDEILSNKTFEHYSSQELPGSITTKHALEHIIFNKPYHAASAHSYWYAFIAICAHLGEAFTGTHEIKAGYETDLINNYLETDFGISLKIEETLLNEKPIFNLPKVQDWPVHGILCTSDLSLLKEKFNNITITDEMLVEVLEEDDEKEMAYDSIRQIKDNALFCLDNNMVLLSFCH